MDEKREYITNNKDYLDLAKSITSSLCDTCTEKEYNIPTVLSALSIGVYMFLKEISKNLEDVKPIELYNEFDGWVRWADSVFENEVQA